MVEGKKELAIATQLFFKKLGKVFIAIYLSLVSFVPFQVFLRYWNAAGSYGQVKVDSPDFRAAPALPRVLPFLAEVFLGYFA